MPKRILTADQIASIPALRSAMGSAAAVARALGVSRHGISYHLRGGKATAYTGKPWAEPMRDARRAIGDGRFAQAAKLLRAAADHCERHA